MSQGAIPLRDYGNTGLRVTQVGLGGEGVLRTFGRSGQAREVLLQALKEGITYFDSARVYAGSEGYYGELWRSRPDDRRRIFQTSKSASRDRAGAIRDLDTTLATMGVDHLDLWQIHDVRTWDDIRSIEGPTGALEAFMEAKASGRVRHIGVTCHHDPAILKEAIRRWPVDAVMMPVNPVEGVLGGFVDDVMELARDKGLAVVAMKTLGAGHYVFPKEGITAEILVRYALSFPVSVVIVGCSTPQHVRELARAGGHPEPLGPSERDRLEGLFRPYAEKMAYYRGWA